MPGDRLFRDDVFSGWLVFDRLGGGYIAVRRATGEHVEADTAGELAAATVMADVARAWRGVADGR